MLCATLALGCMNATQAPRGDPAAVIRAANRERGRVVVAGSAGLVVVGGVFLALSPVEFITGSPHAPSTLGVGIGTAALGSALLTYGLNLLRRP